MLVEEEGEEEEEEEEEGRKKRGRGRGEEGEEEKRRKRELCKLFYERQKKHTKNVGKKNCMQPLLTLQSLHMG